MAEGRGLFVKQAGEANDELGREFMKSPEAFARKHGLDPNNLGCPDIAHQAFDRARAFGKDVEAAAVKPDAASMPKLHDVASRHFGSEYEVALIPFGLQFREKLRDQALDITATGTGTVTWLDTDADVDS